jgi:CheY-like chemotaxis protein
VKNDLIKVMIVEDNPLNLKLAKDLLEIDGYEVWSCNDAEAALEMLKGLRPDVILMDIALPGMDGLELTRALRADETTQDLKIIALTAFAMKSDEARVLAAGCDGYITKPIDTRTFTKQLKEMLV